MSKKHFIKIAEQIRTQIDTACQLPSPTASIHLVAITETANRLCDVFADENPRFDRVRFLAACGFNR